MRGIKKAIDGRVTQMLTVKKIADLVNNEEAAIRYYVYDENAINNYIFYLKVISDTDKVIYEKMSDAEKQKFISTSAEIYMPKMSVDGCARVYQDDSYGFKYTLDKVSRLVKLNKGDANIAVVLYMILHEYGHWNDFLLKDKKVYLYTMPDYEEAKASWEYKKRIQSILRLKTSLNDNDKKMIKNYTEKYNSIPSEQRANRYADKHYEVAYSLLRKERIVH